MTSRRHKADNGGSFLLSLWRCTRLRRSVSRLQLAVFRNWQLKTRSSRLATRNLLSNLCSQNELGIRSFNSQLSVLSSQFPTLNSRISSFKFQAPNLSLAARSKNLYQITIAFTLAIFLLLPSVLLTLPLTLTSVHAAVNQEITFQGKVVDKTDGTNIAPACYNTGASNDTCDFRVGIYSASSGGTALWSEILTDVELEDYDSVFTLNVGSYCITNQGGTWTTDGDGVGTRCTVNTGVDWGADDTIYLQVELDTADTVGENAFSSPETFTRKLITTVPFAFHAEEAATLNGIADTGFVQLQPSSAQSATDTTSLIHLNETGASAPNLLELEVAGADQIVFDNGGGAVFNEQGNDADFRIEGDTDANLFFVDASAERVGIGTTTPDAKLEVAGDITASAWGLNGIQYQSTAATFTDSSTAASGTATNAVFSSYGIPTLAASNASVTTTNAANVYIAGAPTAGTNQTITNAYSLWIDAGVSRFDGGIQLGSDGNDLISQASSGSGASADLYYGNDLVCDVSAVNCGWATSATEFFIQNGNSFGATAVLGTNDSNNLQFETNGTARMTIDTSGDVGIGTSASSLYQLRLYDSTTITSGSRGGQLLDMNFNPSAASSAQVTGLHTQFSVLGSSNATGLQRSIWNEVSSSNSGTVSQSYGYYGTSNTSSGTTSSAYGIRQAVSASGTGAVSTAIGGAFVVSNSSSNDVSTAYGLQVIGASNTGAGSINNNYGLYVANQSAGSNDYGIYVGGADTYALWVDADLARFDGGMQLGSDGNDLISQASSGTGASADLYYGNDLVCDVSEANCGWSTGGGLWTTGTAATYLTTDDDVSIGNGDSATAPFFFNIGTNAMRIGDGTSDANDPTITFYASDASSSASISLLDTGLFSFSASTSYFGGHVIPLVNDTYYLGSSSSRWNTVFTGTNGLQIGSGGTDQGTIAYDTSGNILEFDTDVITNGDIAFFTDDLYLDKSSGMIGVGTTTPDGLLELAGDITASAWGLNGIQYQSTAATFTDSSTAASGTATNAVFSSYGIPTLAASNASVTTTNAANVYIAGAPTAGTNQTITNAYSLWIDAGVSRFDGGIQLGSDGNDLISQASSGTGASADLYYGNDLVCDVSEANCGWSTGGGLWTAGTAATYLTTDDDVSIGNGDSATAPFFFNIGTNAMRIGDGTSDANDPTITFYASDASASSSISVLDGGDFEFTDTILPDTDDAYDLGSTSLRWQDLYLGPQSLHIGTSATDEGVISYNTTTNILGIATDGTTAGDIAFNTDDLYIDTSASSVGIGTDTPSYQYEQVGTLTNTATENTYGGLSTITLNPSAASDTIFTGQRTSLETDASNSQNFTGILIGQAPRVFHNGSGIVDEARGLNLVARNKSTGTITLGIGGNFTIANDSTGEITTARGGNFGVSQGNASGSIADAYGIYIDVTNSGTITNTYGLYIDDITEGTQTNTPFSIYAADSGAINYFAGDVGIGDTTPTYNLDVLSGSATEGIGIDDKLAFSSGDSWLRLNQSQQFASGIYSPGLLRIDGGVIFNDNSTDVDFRVEGNNDDNLFFVDGGTDRIGIGTGSPGEVLHLAQEGGDVAIEFQTNSGSSGPTGPNSAGTGADDSSVGTVAWTNPGNITSSNDSDASIAILGSSLISHYLKATNFGFSIPTTATIDGITVEVERSDPNTDTRDYQVRIVKGGTIGTTDRAETGAWPATDAYQTYGGSTDLWGETWTPSDINGSTFGFAISVEEISGISFGSPTVDHIRITIDYTDGVTWVSGVDYSDGQHFKFSASSTLGTSDILELQSNGDIVVTGNVLPDASPTVSSVSQTAAIVDTTEGSHVEVAASTDGYPIIAYADGGIISSAPSVYVTKCGNDTCDSGNTTTTVLAGSYSTFNVYDVFNEPDIVVRDDGKPLIIAINQWSTTVSGPKGRMTLVNCGNETCSSGNTVTDISTPTAFDNAQIEIAPDGLPVLLANSLSGASLNLVDCGDINCSSGNTTTTLASNGEAGDLEFGADGLPIVTYFDNSGSDLEVIKCGNDACSSGNTATTLDSSSVVGQNSSMEIAPDNMPVISYYLSGISYDLKVYKCTSADCSTGSATTVESTNDVGATSDIEIGIDGLPVISFEDVTNGNLKVIKCQNASCTSTVSTTVESANDVGEFSSLVLPNDDGLPFIAHFDNTSNDLRSFKCAVPDCSASSGSVLSGGSNLGGRSSFFNSVYAGSYYGKNFTINNFDLAEEYAVEDASIKAGDVVRFKKSSEGKLIVERTDSPQDQEVIGVISTEPGLYLKDWEADNENGRPVALAGRVPVKVTDENGQINRGDYLTPASKPGYAMKATEPGIIIGRAMEDFLTVSGDSELVEQELAETQEEAQELADDLEQSGELSASEVDEFVDVIEEVISEEPVSTYGEGRIMMFVDLGYVGESVLGVHEEIEEAITVEQVGAEVSSNDFFALIENEEGISELRLDVANLIVAGSVTIEGDLNVSGSIFAGAITSGDINAGDITAQDVQVETISVGGDRSGELTILTDDLESGTIEIQGMTAQSIVLLNTSGWMPSYHIEKQDGSFKIYLEEQPDQDISIQYLVIN